MASMTNAEVVIGGKVYTIAGYESESYLQKVASYLNNKLNEFSAQEGWAKLNTDTRNILMQINIVDDYFRTQKELQDLRDEMQQKEKDLYDVKHELIATQIKLESTEKSLKSVSSENEDNARKIIRLETELKTREEDKRSTN
ncbi:MAG: cell division protein ZapA [Lachnospiraceae bacterium]|nr:cell division protein ZapA [Lachnospiraceae bacterium]